MKQKYRIDTDFELICSWILPGYSLSEAITGKLIFKNNKLILEVYGDLNYLKEDHTINYLGCGDVIKSYILGFSQDGYTVIIEKPSLMNYKMNSPGMPISVYKANICLLMHINYTQYNYTFDELVDKLISNGINNIDCTNCKFSLTGMNNWMNTKAIKKESTGKKRSIYYDLSKFDLNYFSVQDRNLVFNNNVTCQEKNNSLFEEHFWELETENKSNSSIGKLKSNMDSFKNLIQLFVDSPTEYTFIDFEIPIKGKLKDTITAHYIYLQPKFSEKVNVNIYYTDIQEKFASVLEKWFEKQLQLTIIIDNYLNDINTNYFSESKLLNSIKNLEIYHRNFVDRTNLSQVQNLV